MNFGRCSTPLEQNSFGRLAGLGKKETLFGVYKEKESSETEILNNCMPEFAIMSVALI